MLYDNPDSYRDRLTISPGTIVHSPVTIYLKKTSHISARG